MAKENHLPSGQIQITNGPGKFDFMCSNFDFKKIELTLEHNDRQFLALACIMFACPEDGSRERWIGMISVLHPNKSNVSEWRAYYYDSKKRTGHLVEAGRQWKIGTLPVEQL